MLTSKERLRILAFFCYCSTFCLLPVRVDVQCWNVRPGTDAKWRTRVCKGSFSVFIAHASYKAISLLHALFFCRHVPLHQLLIHGQVAWAAVMLGYWYFLLYVEQADVNAALWGITLTGNIAAGGVNSVLVTFTGAKEGGRLRLSERTLQDLLVILLPYMTPLIAVLIGACILYDPTMNMLLYSVLPAAWKNGLTFGICFLEEMRLLIICIGVAIPALQHQIIAFDLINSKLQEIRGVLPISVSEERVDIGGYCRALRSLQLYTALLNVVNSQLIFSWKLFCLGLCIMSGYAAIAHFSDHPVFGILYYALFFEGSIIYAVMYEKAFKVPDLITQARIACKLRMQSVANLAQRNVLNRQLRSVPPVGIKVGEFHILERTATLVFLHYVFVNIVNMLVTFNCPRSCSGNWVDYPKQTTFDI